jgi:histone acetyltransferase SAS3
MDRNQEDALEGSDLDAEGSEVDEEYERKFANGFVATQTKSNEEADEEEDEIDDDDDGDAAEESSADSDNETNTSTASEAENEWEADTDAAEEGDDSKTTEEHRCV